MREPEERLVLVAIWPLAIIIFVACLRGYNVPWFPASAIGWLGAVGVIAILHTIFKMIRQR